MNECLQVSFHSSKEQKNKKNKFKIRVSQKLVIKEYTFNTNKDNNHLH